ncbi:MAG: transposase [Candidatus Marinimicrobia bacterium]|nr:transposase [Candidatus Neomarinimicrobiota bacterium]MCF7880186.1 transposase [Candidatus Neomarinimicrobiota bacterium]
MVHLEGLKDIEQFYVLPHLDAHLVSSTNVLERLNREIHRRSRVSSLFLNMASYLWLITRYLIIYSDSKKYVSRLIVRLLPCRNYYTLYI